MNELLNKWAARAVRHFGSLSDRARRWYGGALAAGLAVAVGLSLWLNHDPYRVLFTDVQKEDSRAISKSLGEQGIEHRSTDDGATILVPQSKVDTARMQLAKEGIPGQDVVGFEKFDSTTLGMSSYVQRIQYIRAIQGELTRSIQRLAAVKRARVHLSIPAKKAFLEEQDPPKASVVLELRRGKAPTKAEIDGIAHLVSSAVEGLKVNNVTIVDTKGSFLHKPEEQGEQTVSTALLEMQRAIESEYERRVNEILTPVVGYGKVRAKVTVEIDPSRVNTTEETFDPDRSAVRSSTRNEEVSNGSKPNPIGIPGSRSNLPGAEVQQPAVPVANTNSEKNVQNTTYAIPRKIQITDKPSGSIKRVSVAVVVDGNYTKTDKGEVFAPKGEEELNNLRRLVENAIGFDQSRRDSVTVNSLPFRVDQLEELSPELDLPWWKSPGLRQYAIRNLFIVLSILTVFFLSFRWLTRSIQLSSSKSLEAQAYPRTVEQIEAERNQQALALLAERPTEDVLALSDDLAPEKQEEFELRKQVLELFEQSPKKGVRVVQDWLDEDRSLTAGSTTFTAEAAA